MLFQSCKIYLCGTKKDIVEDSPSKREVEVSTAQPLATGIVQSNFNGSNIFGTIENCSRHGWFEPLRVNYGAKLGSK